MKYENSKSAILIFLILVSIVLTWNLWTYQPNFDMMENYDYVAEVTLKEKQELQEIISPDLALFHHNGQHYGTTNAVDLDKMMDSLRKWSFYDITNYSDQVEDIKELVHGNGNAEIVFPADVPIEIYRSVLKFEEKRIPAFNFNRIVINVENSEKGNGTVYFISSDYQNVYRSHISPDLLNDFNRDFFKNAGQYQRYFAFEPTEQRTVFIPDGKLEMMEYTYLPVILNSEAFKEALFSDPSFVQRGTISNGEEYSDVSSKMTINNNTNMLHYVNPNVESNYVDNSYDLLMRSIDFINGHGGWTDPYRYVAIDVKRKSVKFRLYSVDGYPVFNESGMSEIQEVWGRDEITKYVRPNIALELPLTAEMVNVTLPSGSEALEYLKSRKSFKPELLEQLVLGYRMARNTDENKLILLEPAWFYRYNQSWGQITKEDLGGLLHGLE
ncbi:regulatory protein YycH of two-component signal transduction system YycFG [Neobacillus niacini]|uniref:YycH family regulatory protein n=1 Tax=Neobacillus niacini TaxID=86668 RepID=UPI0028645FB8|nr:two-component system activity regulator YycH [Neobacillus niacini]MDR7078774.1 regulatory protein YycH of two-component signal transduction system YycFG [Neobacillus niacini]